MDSNFTEGSRQRGFTLIELMVTVGVIAILVTVVLPGFQSIWRNQQLTGHVNDMVMAINMARSESARRGGDVRIVPVDATDNTNEWGAGWRVEVVSTATVLQQFPGLSADVTMDGPDAVTEIVFNARGLPSTAMTADMCDADQQLGFRVAISAVGRPGVSHLTSAECP